MKKFSYLFFALVLLALACRPALATPSSISVTSHDMAEVTEGDKSLLKVIINCNSVIDDPDLNSPTYIKTIISWNSGTYNVKKKRWQPAPKYNAKTAEMPGDPESFFGAFIPKAWTGAVSIDVHCGIELPYTSDDDDSYGPRPITNGVDLYKDGIMKFAISEQDYFEIYDLQEKLPLWDSSAHLKKIIVKTKNGKIYDFDRYGSLTWSKYRLQSSFKNLELNANSDFPLTLYAVSISTVKHAISVISADKPGGTISPKDDQALYQGEDSSFVVAANDGYRIAKLLIDGEPVAMDSKFLCGYTFKQVEKPHSIEAVFEEYTAAPETSADTGLTVTLIDVLESKEDKEAADFESLGFVDGSRNVNIVSADGKTKAGGTFIADADGFVQAVKLKVEYEEGSEAKGMTLTVKPLDAAKPFSAEKTYYALLLNKSTNYYDLLPASLNKDGNLDIFVKPVGDYFSTGTVFIYSGTAKATGETPAPVPDTESKSGGGCRTGIAAFALLSLLPLLRKRR